MAPTTFSVVLTDTGAGVLFCTPPKSLLNMVQFLAKGESDTARKWASIGRSELL